jgi:predicted metal-dependent HD superfamily phosphohydrolase
MSSATPGSPFGCRRAPFALPPEIERALAAVYAEPHRAYHTAAHIAEVLRWYDHVADEVGWRDPAAVYLAALFHDAVYDPAAKDNEARSAELARRFAGSLAGSLAPTAIDRCGELILLTARHGALEPSTVDADAAHFLDCDTAILGAPPAEFDAYDAAIAAEYRHVPAEAFRAGRRAFLAGMLARPRIFLSELFHARLDAAARGNLSRALARS